MSEQKPTDDAQGNGAAHEAAPASGDQTQALQEQLEKAKNDFLYLRAEFENYKKNAIKERSDLIKYGAERFMRDLFGVLDNFERALSTQVTADNFAMFRQGVEMTSNEMKSLLQKHGVSEITSLGQPFDPAIHEALTSENSTEMAPGHVLRVFNKGYRLNDKLIRPAQVVVAKKPE